MQPTTKTSLFAASVSLVTAVGAAIFMDSWFELPVLVMSAFGFGILAAVVSYTVVFFTVSRRVGRVLPVLGPVRGARLLC